MWDVLKWSLFGLAVLGLLVADLRRGRDAARMPMRTALLWSGAWILISLLFAASIYLGAPDGSEQSLQFLTGYLIEKALSVDNLFIFLIIFRHFKISPVQQHRVLFWGVFGAIFMRTVLILIGVELLHQFEVLYFLFGAILLYAAAHMALHGDTKFDPERSWIVRLARRWLPFTHHPEGDRMFVRIDGRRLFTQLFLVLLVVEIADLVFAVDSIPAVLAISPSFFIVLTSNIFAVLGLRALYFVLAGLIDRFRFLDAGLAAILAFVGGKMLLAPKAHFHQAWTLELPTAVTLAVIGGILLIAVLASWLAPMPQSDPSQALPADPPPGQAGGSPGQSGPTGAASAPIPTPSSEAVREPDEPTA
ncbi:MAG: TerC/Alx family metal homeostasis membrane protein [Planctomycetota bacterium]